MKVAAQKISLHYFRFPRAEVVERYANLMQEGVRFPPVLVAQPWPGFAIENAEYVVIDGQLRVLAARRAGFREIEAHLVEVSGEEEALAVFYRANSRHGLPLSRAEEREIIFRLRRQGLTQEAIARLLGISQRTVSRLLGRDRDPHPRKRAEEEVREILERGGEIKVNEIQKRFGVSKRTAYRILQRARLSQAPSGSEKEKSQESIQRNNASFGFFRVENFLEDLAGLQEIERFLELALAGMTFSFGVPLKEIEKVSEESKMAKIHELRDLRNQENIREILFQIARLHGEVQAFLEFFRSFIDVLPKGDPHEGKISGVRMVQ